MGGIGHCRLPENVVSTFHIRSAVKQESARRLRDGSTDWLQCQSKHCLLPAASTPQDGPRQTVIDLAQVSRRAIAITPATRGDFGEQAREVLSELETAVGPGQPHPMTVTTQTVFLAAAEDRKKCGILFRRHFGDRLPVTNYVLQPPCSGAALALEAWALGGPTVAVERHSPTSLSVSCEGLRWIYCGGIQARWNESGPYEQTLEVLRNLRRELERAGAGIDDMVRTWFYQGGITAKHAGVQRYREFNRARTACYRKIRFGHALMRGRNGHALYPASTGIGMQGRGMVGTCLALRTDRTDVRLLPLENPGQVPAYHYSAGYSPQSPKFSRALAALLGDYGITWISGTASIVHSESTFPGDIERQTHQTLDNIERLISPENFALHGAPRAGATLGDLAKVRVYVKRAEDYPTCRAVCEQRLGRLPAVYAIADICRPELLVEIEGVAFSRLGMRRAQHAGVTR